MRIYAGSQLNLGFLEIQYRDEQGTVWNLLGTSNTKQGEIVVALGHSKKKLMKHVAYEDVQAHYTKITEPLTCDADPVFVDPATKRLITVR